MKRTNVSVLALLLTSISTVSFLSAQNIEPPALKNKIAVEATKRYETAMAAAQKEYIDQLKLAVRDEGAKGNLDEANAIQERISLVEDEAEDHRTALHKSIEGSKWEWRLANNTTGTLRFMEHNRAVDNAGMEFNWAAVDKETIVIHNPKLDAISVWEIAEKHRKGQGFRFVQNRKESSALTRK